MAERTQTGEKLKNKKLSLQIGEFSFFNDMQTTQTTEGFKMTQVNQEFLCVIGRLKPTCRCI